MLDSHEFLSAQILPLWDTWRIQQSLSPPMLPLVAPVPVCLSFPWIHKPTASALASCRERICRCWLLCQMLFGKVNTDQCSSWEPRPPWGVPSCSSSFLSWDPVPIFLKVFQHQSFLPFPSDSFPLLQLELPSLIWRQDGLVLCLVFQICYLFHESFFCHLVASRWQCCPMIYFETETRKLNEILGMNSVPLTVLEFCYSYLLFVYWRIKP